MSDIEFVDATWCGIPLTELVQVEYNYAPLDVDGRLVEREDATVTMRTVVQETVTVEKGEGDIDVVVVTADGVNEWRLLHPPAFGKLLHVPAGTGLVVKFNLRRLPQ